MTNQPVIHIVGGGLAGSEAAWQCLQQGYQVALHEMRPVKMTDAHKTGNLAELVCSNSFKSYGDSSAPGQLKTEMRALDSLILRCADVARVPAGQALAVEREQFSGEIAKSLEEFPGFQRVAEEVTNLPTAEAMAERNECWIVATGPLTTSGLAEKLRGIAGLEKGLYFYDAIAPIIDGETIDKSKMFWGSRYESSEEGDYLNIPLNRRQYEDFVDAVAAAEKMPLHEFEDTKYFEACLPIEVMVERGKDTLRFGPLKPVGFLDPKTLQMPWAVIQLRKENRDATMFSMVGFQTKMKYPEQKRVFATLPGLENAEFLRLGSVHRNTYFNSPKILSSDLSLRTSPRIFLAGQITGVEGYTESAAIGLLAARAACAKLAGKQFAMPPKNTMLGALAAYVTEGPVGDFQPMNANLGLLPPVPKTKVFRKNDRKAMQCKLATESFRSYCESMS